MNLVALVSSLRHPSYTGRAREPGFVVANVLVVSLLAVGVERLVPLAGTLLIGVSVVLLVLRGYAVPGTPALVRAVTEWSASAGTPDPVPQDEQELLRAGVLARANGGFQPTASFLAAWRARVRSAGPREDDARALSEALGVDPERVTLRWRAGVLFAEVSGTPLGAWLSRAALVADTASIHELRRRYPQWDLSSPQRRGAMLSTLRLYLDVCPACDGTTVLDRAASRVPGALGRTVAVTCADCDARLFESAFSASVAVVGDDTSPSVVGR
ncbi:hypothetical protein C2R22_11210 [Salinigranum rubrum]|uniref:Uncharacterized protein n=1 Tax=Salinigranum rubrum TaxID=755307 RepID=A0A2I8VJR2_9EURY|nr:hypothetical protein [Salinigranum rubrum]AUV82145.1 hypothetical protein C2R22_11210 [Salinigranum rubrum]